MKILVAYATTEGQTRKIARHVADRLAEQGHAVELLHVTDAEGLNPGRFDGAILAASVHGGQFQGDFRDFASDASARLEAMPTLFLPVSLAAAGDDPEDWDGLRHVVERFQDETGWTPGRIEHVAGAFRFGEYDFFKSWAMRWIAREKDQTVDPHGDTEYTDWQRLGTVVDDWAASLG